MAFPESLSFQRHVATGGATPSDVWHNESTASEKFIKSLAKMSTDVAKIEKANTVLFESTGEVLANLGTSVSGVKVVWTNPDGTKEMMVQRENKAKNNVLVEVGRDEDGHPIFEVKPHGQNPGGSQYSEDMLRAKIYLWRNASFAAEVVSSGGSASGVEHSLAAYFTMRRELQEELGLRKLLNRDFGKLLAQLEGLNTAEEKSGFLQEMGEYFDGVDAEYENSEGLLADVKIEDFAYDNYFLPNKDRLVSEEGDRLAAAKKAVNPPIAEFRLSENLLQKVRSITINPDTLENIYRHGAVARVGWIKEDYSPGRPRRDGFLQAKELLNVPEAVSLDPKYATFDMTAQGRKILAERGHTINLQEIKTLEAAGIPPRADIAAYHEDIPLWRGSHFNHGHDLDDHDQLIKNTHIRAGDTHLLAGKFEQNIQILLESQEIFDNVTREKITSAIENIKTYHGIVSQFSDEEIEGAGFHEGVYRAENDYLLKLVAKLEDKLARDNSDEWGRENEPFVAGQ